MGTVIAATLAALALALAAIAGRLLTRRAGEVHPTSPGSAGGPGLSLSRTGPTVVHFSAPWCAPCAQVRDVVTRVCGEVGDAAHAEVDIDSNQIAAQEFTVISLPTVVIFDPEGRQRYRTTGVPKADALRSALTALLA
jgi:thiol-disulfide isomerase/thioredoxin